jgi:hypothetical protein
MIARGDARRHPVGRGIQHFHKFTAQVTGALLNDLHAHPFAGKAAAHKHYQTLHTANPVAALGDTVEGEFQIFSMIHMRRIQDSGF